jgi:hypothetical protein
LSLNDLFFFQIISELQPILAKPKYARHEVARSQAPWMCTISTISDSRFVTFAAMASVFGCILWM